MARGRATLLPLPHGRADDAAAVFASLASVGVDVADVYEVLEREGVEKFEKSWSELLETVEGQLSKASGKEG